MIGCKNSRQRGVSARESAAGCIFTRAALPAALVLKEDPVLLVSVFLLFDVKLTASSPFLCKVLYTRILQPVRTEMDDQVMHFEKIN
jgi:hypothetical protein